MEFDYNTIFDENENRKTKIQALQLDKENHDHFKKDGFGMFISSFYPDVAINEKVSNGELLVNIKNSSVDLSLFEEQKEIYNAEISQLKKLKEEDISDINLLICLLKDTRKANRINILEKLSLKVLDVLKMDSRNFKRESINDLFGQLNLNKMATSRITNSVLKYLLESGFIIENKAQSKTYYDYTKRELKTLDDKKRYVCENSAIASSMAINSLSIKRVKRRYTFKKTFELI